MTQLVKPKAILFDWDNTLVDSWPVVHECFTHTLQFMNKKPWSLEEVKDRAHKSLNDSFPDIFGHRWQEAKDIFVKHFLKIRKHKTIPLAGAESLLNILYENDIFMAVISNKMGEHLRQEVDALEWNKYFAATIGANDAKNDKPSADVVHMALSGSGILPGKDVWLIGDTLSDMECAHNSGCLAVFYGTFEPDKESAKFTPHLQVEDHQSLLQLINKYL